MQLLAGHMNNEQAPNPPRLRLTPEQQEKVLLEATNPKKISRLIDLVDFVKREFGVTYTIQGIRKLLIRNGYTKGVK